MRVVMIAGLAEIGGAERAALDLIASMRKADPKRPLFLIVPGDGPLLRSAEALGVDVRILPYPRSIASLGESSVREGRGVAERISGFAALTFRLATAAYPIKKYVAALRRLLEEIDPDVIHTHGMKPHAMAAFAAPSRSALVWHMHDLVAERPIMQHVLKRLSRRVDGSIAVSTPVLQQLRETSGRRLQPSLVLNAVDIDTFSPLGEVADLDALAGLPQAMPGILRVGLIATAGRFKGHETFLDALQLLNGRAQLRSYIVGGSVYKTHNSEVAVSSLREMASSRNVDVGFTGHVSNPAAAMRALDIVVHATTRPEPFGLVVVEAMACARAVIASEAGGVLEIASPGTDCLTHSPGDSCGLADALTMLLDDPVLRERLSQSARRTAETRFDRTRLAAQVDRVYDGAISVSRIRSGTTG